MVSEKWEGVNEMVQGVKGLSAETEDLNSIPEIYKAESANWFPPVAP